MRAVLLNLWISFELFWSRLFRSVGNAVSTSFSALNGAIGKVIHSDQRLREVQEMTEQQMFIHWTAQLGLAQSQRRHVLEGKKLDITTGVISDHTYTDEEIARAKKEIDLIEEDTWALAAAYRDGKVFQFVETKRNESIFTETEIYEQEDGTVAIINKETNKARILDKNGKEIKTIDADEVACTPKVSSITDKEGIYSY